MLQYLVRVVQQWTVVTMITDSIHVSVFLVSVIHIGAVVAFIQNVWKINRKTLSTLDTIVGLFFFVVPFFLPSPSMSIAQASPSPLWSVSI